MMNDSRLYVHVLLDRSGSMETCRDKTIDAFNEFVNGLKVQSKAGTRLSLSTFDSESTDLVFDTLKIAAVPRLTRSSCEPRALTPLFDAVASTVAHIDKVNLLPDERVVFAILTDGLENASAEMTAEAVKKLLVDRQERRNWLVQYLGANQNAWAAGAQIGVAAHLAMDFDTGHVATAMDSMARSAHRFRAASVASARVAGAFTDDERARSRPAKR